MLKKVLFGLAFVLCLAVSAQTADWNIGTLYDETDNAYTFTMDSTSLIDTSVVLDMSRFKDLSVGCLVARDTTTVAVRLDMYESNNGSNWVFSDSLPQIDSTLAKSYTMKKMTRLAEARYVMFVFSSIAGHHETSAVVTFKLID